MWRGVCEICGKQVGTHWRGRSVATEPRRHAEGVPRLIPRLAEGWHDLASGGAVEIQRGIPIRITDKGSGDLDEHQIFAEAAAMTGMRLTLTLARAGRWRRDRLRSLFRRDKRWRWSYAVVLRAPCEICGVEAGVCWAKERGVEPLSWVDDDCARNSPDVER